MISPYALFEAILKRRIDWLDPSSAYLMSAVLQTHRHKLFDPKIGSPLYAGFQLNASIGEMEKLAPEQIEYIESTDQLTPDLSQVEKLGDLAKVGVADLADLEVTETGLHNGQPKLFLQTLALNCTMSSRRLPKHVADLLPPRQKMPTEGALSSSSNSDDWTPGGWAAWGDMGDFFKKSTEFDHPIQGGTGDCWLIAACPPWLGLYHTASCIGCGPPPENDTGHVNAITLYQKGGVPDALSATVEQSDKALVRTYGDWSV